MTREDIAIERALKLHDLALSVLRAKGVVKLDGLASGLEYRHGLLNIQYRPDQGQLDVWFERRVLSVERFRHKTQVLRYVPGHWERHLFEAARVAARTMTDDARALQLVTSSSAVQISNMWRFRFPSRKPAPTFPLDGAWGASSPPSAAGNQSAKSSAATSFAASRM